MKESVPKNIVEAYAIASKATLLHSDKRQESFNKVIAFCEGDNTCPWDRSLKRNTLLFWAYDKVAQSYFDNGQYNMALDMWGKSKRLIKSPYARICLGGKMLEAADLCKFSIPKKATRIAEIAVYLQQSYKDIGDEENAQRMQRLCSTAEYLLNMSRLKH